MVNAYRVVFVKLFIFIHSYSIVVYHCLFALKNFAKISPEVTDYPASGFAITLFAKDRKFTLLSFQYLQVVNLTSVIGIDLSKFVKLSKKIEEICNELEQYLIV